MIYLQQMAHVPFQKEEISIWFQKEVFVTLDVIIALKKGIQLTFFSGVEQSVEINYSNSVSTEYF
jgi:hypothetical protein